MFSIIEISLKRYTDKKIIYLKRDIVNIPYEICGKIRMNKQKKELKIVNYYQRIRDIREDREQKQVEIAELLKTTQHQISKYENGIQMMGIDKYIILAKHYDVSLDYLCGLIDHPEPISTRKKRKSL